MARRGTRSTSATRREPCCKRYPAQETRAAATMLYWVTQGVLDWSAVTHPVVMDHGVARDGQVKGLTSPLSPCMEAAPALWGRHAAAVDYLRLFSREVVEAAVKPNPNPATHTHAHRWRSAAPASACSAPSSGTRRSGATAGAKTSTLPSAAMMPSLYFGEQFPRLGAPRVPPLADDAKHLRGQVRLRAV